MPNMSNQNYRFTRKSLVESEFKNKKLVRKVDAKGCQVPFPIFTARDTAT